VARVRFPAADLPWVRGQPEQQGAGTLPGLDERLLASRGTRAAAVLADPAAPASPMGNPDLSESGSSRIQRPDCAPRSDELRPHPGPTVRSARQGAFGTSTRCGAGTCPCGGRLRYAPRTCSRTRVCRE
jgi:hypothetical protein